MTRAGQAAKARDMAVVIRYPRSAEAVSSTVRASLRFVPGGGRTVLAHQRAPYPFHLTRPFYLDPARPDLATLYIQSVSGGLYRGDRTELVIDVAAGAAAHVTTQAPTIVHDARGDGAVQHQRLTLAPESFLAFTPDPLVLFPGASFESATEIMLAPGTTAIISDGVAHHDPQGDGKPFARYATSTVVRGNEGRVLLADRGALSGTAFSSEASPLGPYRAVGSLLVLGTGAERVDSIELEARLDQLGCLAGFSRVPANLGLGGRILAPNGGVLARGLETAFAFAFEALLGAPPARRRK